jgi:uncharacterized protein YdaU (DUF1376 family)
MHGRGFAAMPMYVRDFMTGTVTMTPAQVGAYWRCLMYQWDSGAVPADDPRQLAKIIGCGPRQALHYWKVVGPKFRRGADGLWRNTRCEKERAARERFLAEQKHRALQRWSGQSRIS